MKKFSICKTCLIGFVAVFPAGCGETVVTAVKKTDAFIYEHADKVAHKDEVAGCLLLERCEAMKKFYFANCA